MEHKPHLQQFMSSIYGKGFKSSLAVIFLCAMITTAAQFFYTYDLGNIIDSVDAGYHSVIRHFIAISAAVFLSAAGNTVWSLLSGRLENKFIKQIRLELGMALCQSEYAEIEKINDGDLLSIVTNDVEQYRPWLRSLCSIGLVPVKLVISILCLFLISWNLSLGTILFIPLAILPSMLLSKKLHALNTAERETAGKTTGFLNTALDLIIVVKSFCLEQSFMEKNRGLLTEAEKARRRRLFREQIIQTFGRCLGNVLNPLIFIIAALLIINGEMTIGQTVVIILLANFIGEALNIIYAIPTNHQGACAVTQRVKKILDMKREECDQSEDPRSVADTLLPCFETDKLTFSYENDMVLQGINLTIYNGEKIAIVGTSGSGKTTMMKLLCGLYRPARGQVFFKGADTGLLSRQTLRKEFSVAPQEAFIFKDSVKNNILIARPDASDEEVHEACRKASIHDIITSMDSGYDTVLGDAGRLLSKGQMQRINLARAFLKDAPVLLLDEPVSALDAASRKRVMDAILDRSGSRTAIVILHGLTEPERFDRILVMDKGTVCGFDRYDRLQRSCHAPMALFTQTARLDGKAGEGA